jgi:monofunctional biosynthetic peptidoglycan transglycosylase
MKRVGKWAGAALAAVFAAVAYAYVTLPDVRPLETVNPPSTAFIQLRLDEAREAGKVPKQVQRWIAYRRIAPTLTRAVLVAEDAAFFQHEAWTTTNCRNQLSSIGRDFS